MDISNHTKTFISGVSSREHEEIRMKLKHFTYAGLWKKFEPVWNFLIKNELLGKTRGALVKTLK